MKQIINGKEIDLTPEEVIEYNERQAQWEAGNPQRMIDSFTKALEDAIDAKAAEKSYSSAVSCASYKDSTNAQWAAESTAFIAWRDICYEYSYDYLAKAQDGTIPNPNLDDFISGLPVMEWPTTQEG